MRLSVVLPCWWDQVPGDEGTSVLDAQNESSTAAPDYFGACFDGLGDEDTREPLLSLSLFFLASQIESLVLESLNAGVPLDAIEAGLGAELHRQCMTDIWSKIRQDGTKKPLEEAPDSVMETIGTGNMDSPARMYNVPDLDEKVANLLAPLQIAWKVGLAKAQIVKLKEAGCEDDIGLGRQLDDRLQKRSQAAKHLEQVTEEIVRGLQEIRQYKARQAEEARQREQRQEEARQQAERLAQAAALKRQQKKEAAAAKQAALQAQRAREAEAEAKLRACNPYAHANKAAMAEYQALVGPHVPVVDVKEVQHLRLPDTPDEAWQCVEELQALLHDCWQRSPHLHPDWYEQALDDALWLHCFQMGAAAVGFPLLHSEGYNSFHRGYAFWLSTLPPTEERDSLKSELLEAIPKLQPCWDVAVALEELIAYGVPGEEAASKEQQMRAAIDCWFEHDEAATFDGQQPADLNLQPRHAGFGRCFGLAERSCLSFPRLPAPPLVVARDSAAMADYYASTVEAAGTAGSWSTDVIRFGLPPCMTGQPSQIALALQLERFWRSARALARTPGLEDFFSTLGSLVTRSVVFEFCRSRALPVTWADHEGAATFSPEFKGQFMDECGRQALRDCCDLMKVYLDALEAARLLTYAHLKAPTAQGALHGNTAEMPMTFSQMIEERTRILKKLMRDSGKSHARDSEKRLGGKASKKPNSVGEVESDIRKATVPLAGSPDKVTARKLKQALQSPKYLNGSSAEFNDTSEGTKAAINNTSNPGSERLDAMVYLIQQVTWDPVTDIPVALPLIAPLYG